MLSARIFAAAVGYESMLIVVRGQNKVNGKWAVLAATEPLDATDGYWYTCDGLPVPHQQLKAAAVNNALYLLGGNDPKSSFKVFTASLDNPSSHQLKRQSLPDTPWCLSTPVVLYSKFLLTVGGILPSDESNKISEVCAFNPSTGLWRQIANIPAARNFAGVVGVANNKIIMLGGSASASSQ